MPNELLIIFSLLVIYFSVILWYRLFGAGGLIGFSVFATVAANVEVLIVVEAFGMEQTLGNVLFASTFLITDILSETEGKKASQKAVNIGIAASVSFALLSQLWLLYTPAASDRVFSSVQTVFSGIPRVIFVSLAVYAVTQKFDVWVYHKWWDFTTKKFGDKRKYLWLRNNVSTLLSQLLNTSLFTFGAFLGTYDFATVVSIAASSYVIYIFTSLLDTPFVYRARRIYEKKQSLLNNHEKERIS